MKSLYGFALVFIAGFGLYPNMASAQLETTAEMLSYCDGTSELGVSGADFCTGYLSGVLDTAVLEQELGSDPIFCLPADGLTINETIALLESYARRNPESLNEEFLATMYFALLEKYPCF